MITQDLPLTICGQRYNILRFSTGASNMYSCGAARHAEYLWFRHKERHKAALTIQTHLRRRVAIKLRHRRMSAILLIQYRLRKWSRKQLVPGGKLAQQAEHRYYQV